MLSDSDWRQNGQGRQGGGDRALTLRQHVRPPYTFRGQNDPFSNYYVCGITINYIWYPTSEHAYQDKKAVEMNDVELAHKILNTSTPQDAKYYSNQVIVNDYWHSIKQGVMYDILQVKVNQCTEFDQRLRDSQGHVLIEATNNEYWAEGKNGDGLNTLGHLLMILRDEICNAVSVPSHKHRYAATRDNQPACFYCGETGHITYHCKWQGPIKCHSCSELGHKAKLCPYSSIN